MNKKLLICTSVLALATLGQAGTIVYGLKSRAVSPGPSGSPTHLFRFDGTTGGLVDVGAVTLNGAQVDADGLAWTGSNLVGFVLETGGSRLVSIDRSTAVATSLAFYSGVVMRGATYRAGSIYGLDVLAGSHYNVIEIDMVPLTLRSTALNTTISDVCDLDFAANGDLWVAEMNAFHRLNPATGALSFVAADNFLETPTSPVANTGFVFDETTPLRALTFEVTQNDDIYTYALPGPSRTMFVSNLIPSFNSGRGDLAAVPEPAACTALAIGLVALGRRRRARSSDH